MKNLLKYLLLSIIALAFYDSARGAYPCGQETVSANLPIEIIEADTYISSPDYALSVPRQVSFANSARLQSSSRRQDSTQRQNTECVKSGKVINSGIRFVALRQSLFSHSSLTEPSHTLTRLCRFII